MAEIEAYEIRLTGQFSNELVVSKIKVFTTIEEAINSAKEVAKKATELKYKGVE